MKTGGHGLGLAIARESSHQLQWRNHSRKSIWLRKQIYIQPQFEIKLQNPFTYLAFHGIIAFVREIAAGKHEARQQVSYDK